MMKKLFVLLLVIVVFCSGCSGSQNEKNQEAESQSGMEKEEETGSTEAEKVNEKDEETGSTEAEKVNEKDTEERNLTDSSNTSAPKIDYGTTADEFLTSAPVNGMVNDLTDSSFMTRPAFAGGDPGDEVFTNVVYDKETVQFKTASVKADGSSFSVSEGQRDDLVEGAMVQVYGNANEDGTFHAIEIIVVNFDYN